MKLQQCGHQKMFEGCRLEASRHIWDVSLSCNSYGAIQPVTWCTGKCYQRSQSAFVWISCVRSVKLGRMERLEGGWAIVASFESYQLVQSFKVWSKDHFLLGQWVRNFHRVQIQVSHVFPSRVSQDQEFIFKSGSPSVSWVRSQQGGCEVNAVTAMLKQLGALGDDDVWKGFWT